MNTHDIHYFRRRVWLGMVAGVALACALLLTSLAAFANTVHIYDNAGVLNASQVQNTASALPYPIDIYTVNNFNGDFNAFAQQTTSHVANSSNLVVIAIDTVHHYIAIKAGSRVPLSNSGAQNAVNAFKNNYSGGNYTAATQAALSSLQSSLNAANSNSGSSSNSGTTPVPSGGGLFNGFGFSTICCIGLLVLAGLAIFSFTRRRRATGGGPFGGGLFNRGPVNQPYNQPYNQGYPPGYNQGYPYPPQNQGGIGPWGAGGLGAAAGGFVGYELGKEAGEREAERQGMGGFDNNAGNFGGGAGGDFGGGGNDPNAGNFGGGAGGSFGGDSGGNDGGFIAGSGDFGGGGGGGGGDFGGGGGGNF